METYELAESLRTLAAIIKGQDGALTAALGNMLKPVVSVFWGYIDLSMLSDSLVGTELYE